MQLFVLCFKKTLKIKGFKLITSLLIKLFWKIMFHDLNCSRIFKCL
jgi:hypothetical protein